jgi:hypothetical protein
MADARTTDGRPSTTCVSTGTAPRRDPVDDGPGSLVEAFLLTADQVVHVAHGVGDEAVGIDDREDVNGRVEPLGERQPVARGGARGVAAVRRDQDGVVHD